MGFDGKDYTWKCQSELPENLKLGKVTVSCEGYDNPDDSHVLVGSCGLKYTLNYVEPIRPNPVRSIIGPTQPIVGPVTSTTIKTTIYEPVISGMNDKPREEMSTTSFVIIIFVLMLIFGFAVGCGAQQTKEQEKYDFERRSDKLKSKMENNNQRSPVSSQTTNGTSSTRHRQTTEPSRSFVEPTSFRQPVRDTVVHHHIPAPIQIIQTNVTPSAMRPVVVFQEQMPTSPIVPIIVGSIVHQSPIPKVLSRESNTLVETVTVTTTSKPAEDTHVSTSFGETERR
jgi:hypothetical protein